MHIILYIHIRWALCYTAQTVYFDKMAESHGRSGWGDFIELININKQVHQTCHVKKTCLNIRILHHRYILLQNIHLSLKNTISKCQF